MRVADSLTLPIELERARAAGELVVFAGAGVSMGPPASLPGFKGLAQEIAGGTIPWSDSYETALDRYLGDVERAGVLVQERARRILTPRSAHNPIHEDLIGIFGAPERVRLITTNFDPYFTTAAARVFPGATIREYVGPALPPGGRFSGIAHLHGALAHPEDRLVLTDQDFAEAYIADGWAARFLVQVFLGRTVLFVGYSVSDPLMQYLLRALTPTGRWYGLWHEEEVDRAVSHRIVPVPFGTDSTGDRFGDLNAGMRRWRWFATASESVHDRELRRLISAGPPKSPIDTDYFRERLATEPGLRTFWQTADTTEWFDWAASEGLLDILTEPARFDQAGRGWGQWCLERFCTGENPPLLRFLRGRPLTLHPGFLDALIVDLSRRDPWPPRPVVRQLVALIVSSPHSGAVRDWLDWLMKRLFQEQCIPEAIALLRYATQVTLQPIERYWMSLEGQDDEQATLPIANRVRTLVSPDDLSDLLSKHGPSVAESDAEGLLALGIQRLEEVYELIDLARGNDDTTDWLSFGRTAIAPSNQDTVAHAEDVLILMIRAVLDRWAEVDLEKLRGFADRHSQSRRNLFRRLALYALAKCEACESDEVLRRATIEGWPRDVWLRPELYKLLRSHYPSASEKAREVFVAALRDDSWWGSDFDDGDRHARFSMSQMLLRLTPDSEATKAFAAAEESAHEEWREGDPDGLLSRVEVGWGGNEPSPIEPAQMLTWSPQETLNRVVQELRGEVGRLDRWALLGAVQQAVISRPEWGIRLYEECLKQTEEEPTRVAISVLWGLREATASVPEQVDFLRIAPPSAWTVEHASAFAMVLEKWADKLEKTAESDLLDLLDTAADLIFVASAEHPPGITHEGWTERAINHPAGKAAQVWWRVAVARDWVDGRFEISVDDAERTRWERVLEDKTAAGAFARPILGMVTDRLAAADFPWAARVVFSRFDPASGADVAGQLWDGRLMQSRFFWGTIDGLSPHLDALFAVSSTLIPARSRQLGDWVALLVANVQESGLSLIQLQSFVRHASTEARQAFADALPRHLERLTPDDRVHVWRTFLQPYWRDRRTNVPTPLTPEEVREMISWIAALSEVASEAVAELQLSGVGKMEHADGVIFEWGEDPAWIDAHPAEAVGVIEFLSRTGSINPWMADRAVEILERALASGADRATVRQVAESLVPVSRSAALLVERLDSGT